MKVHNYQKKLKELIETGRMPDDGRAHILNIRHDDWCKINKGKFCNCQPEFWLDGVQIEPEPTVQ